MQLFQLAAPFSARIGAGLWFLVGKADFKAEGGGMKDESNDPPAAGAIIYFNAQK